MAISGHSTPPERIARALLTPFADKRLRRVLHVGSGYLTALLAQRAHEVVTVERVSAMADVAKRHFADLAIGNITVLRGDGEVGVDTMAPFDGILVSTPAVNDKTHLLQQLVNKGRLIALEDSSRQAQWR